jgi:hypothetical protein
MATPVYVNVGLLTHIDSTSLRQQLMCRGYKDFFPNSTQTSLQITLRRLYQGHFLSFSIERPPVK